MGDGKFIAVGEEGNKHIIHIDQIKDKQTKEKMKDKAKPLKEIAKEKEELSFEDAPKELNKEHSKEYKSLESQRDGIVKQISSLNERKKTAKTQEAKDAIQRGIDARKERINKLEDAMLKELKKANNSLYTHEFIEY